MYSSKIMKLAVVSRFMDVLLISVSLVIFCPFEMGWGRGLIHRTIIAGPATYVNDPRTRMVSKQWIITTASNPPLHPSQSSQVSERQHGTVKEWMEVKLKVPTVKLTSARSVFFRRIDGNRQMCSLCHYRGNPFKRLIVMGLLKHFRGNFS